MSERLLNKKKQDENTIEYFDEGIIKTSDILKVLETLSQKEND